MGPEAFAEIFPKQIICQEITTDSYVLIPEEFLEAKEKTEAGR